MAASSTVGTETGEVARAQEASPCDGITTVGVAAIPGLWGEPGGRHDLAALACGGPSAGAPVPAGARLLDQEALVAFGRQLPDEVSEVTPACTEGAEGDAGGVVVVGATGAGPGVVMDKRAIRPGVWWRKGSFGTQSVEGSRFVEAMMAVVATLKQQHRHVLEYMTAAYEATRRGEPAPS